MRILVYPHDLGLGGSQINAIECAAAARDLGHEVVVFGQPGPLTELIHDLGLPFVQSPPVHRRPTPSVVAALRQVVRERGIQVLHGYEWPPALECYLAARTCRRVTAVASIMSMAVAPFIPTTLPLIVGTHQIAATERDAGRRDVTVVEPPVDVDRNSADRLDVDAARFVRRWSLKARSARIVIVSRLAHELKVEGIVTAIATVGRMRTQRPVQLVIVGDGPAARQVHEAAQRANDAAGDEAVVLTGALQDPRPAYAAADVCLGMGSSILRAMAFGKPVIVQGEQGFWQLLTPESIDRFFWQGWFGVGEGSELGGIALKETLGRLMDDGPLRERLGAFGRHVVVSRFSLASAGRSLTTVYARAAAGSFGVGAQLHADVISARQFAGYSLTRAVKDLRHRLPADDFNAAPVVGMRSQPGTGAA